MKEPTPANRREDEAARAAGIEAFLTDWCAMVPEAKEDTERLYYAYRVSCAIERQLIASKEAFLERLSSPPHLAYIMGSEIWGIGLSPAFEGWLASFAAA